MLFDTHVHLNDPAFSDYKKVIEEAINDGVKKMLVVGYDLESSKRAIEIAKEYPFIYASIGIHPSEANKDYKQDLKELDKLITNKVVAIGEIGLDYHYDGFDKDKQKDLFIKQLEIAKKHNLPISIHSRDACNDTFSILKEYKDCYKKGVMHCYSYSLEMAYEFIKLNLYLGIGGVVTYKNAKEIKKVVENIDLNNIVLETDCPYLTPTPFRGKRNEPKFVKYVLNEISLIKNIEKIIVEEITYKNACDLLGVSDED